MTVSYMCQCQLSSVELASGAAMPPCAATVCERVGKTLVSTATFKFAARELQSRAHAGAAGADHERVELADGDCHAHHRHRIWMVQPTYTASSRSVPTCSVSLSPSGLM